MRPTMSSLVLGVGVLAVAATTVFARGGHPGGGGGGGAARGGSVYRGGPTYRGGSVYRGGSTYRSGSMNRSGSTYRSGSMYRSGKGPGSRNRNFRNWSRHCWFPRYGCYGYFCPDDGLWYYWYGPSNCYLPVDDMETYPPDDSMNAPPALPPGATSLP